MRTRVAIVFVFLLVAAGAAIRADRYENVPLRATFDRFPMQIGEWRGANLPPMDSKVLAVLGADDYMMRQSGSAKGAVGLYVGYWQSQRQGDTIHSPLNCLPGAGWQPMSQRIIDVPDPRAPGGPAIPMNRVVIRKGLDSQLVLYWYQSHGRVVASEYWGKFYLVADAVRLNKSDGAIVRIITPIAPQAGLTEEKAEQTALAFSRELMPNFSGFLPN